MSREPMWRRYLRMVGPDPAGDARDEIDHHLEMRTREYEAQGLSPEEARGAALARFGDVERVRREVEEVDRAGIRRARRRDWWDGLGQDARYAVRVLGRSRGFAVVALLTLALGIGATTAVFSVVNAVLLRPLPYADPDRVVELVNEWDGEERGRLSPLEYFDFREGLRSFEALAAYGTGPMNLTGVDEPERLTAGFVSADVFPALGVGAEVGRVFTRAEEGPGAERVALLGHGLWVRRFGGSREVVGQTLVLNGNPTVVLGVMPPEFRLPSEIRDGEKADLYLPLGLDRSSVPNRGSHFLLSVGRLRPGVSVDEARSEVAAAAQGFVRDFPEDYSADMRFASTVEPIGEAVVGPVRPVLLVVAGAVALVLLVACANVANLLLVRADARRRELAVRGALGASAGRVARQLMVESAVLGLAGGLAGVALAWAAIQAIPLVQPPDLPRLDQVEMDPVVLGFALGVSLLTALLFGIAPAIHAAKTDVQSTLRESGRTATSGAARRRVRGALVVGEVALAVVLLLGAGLLIRSLVALYGVDPGFRTEGVLTLRLSVPSAAYPEDEQTVGFYRELLDRLEGLPGVAAAGAVTDLPLASSLGDIGFEIQGRPIPEDEAKLRTDYQVVTPGYFRAVGMQVVRGRGIEPRDDERAPGAVVINETLARQYWPGADPIGDRVMLVDGVGLGWATVVGIARDVRHADLREPPRPEVYVPHAQFRHWNSEAAMRTLTLAIRTPGEPMDLVPSVRAEIRRIDPNLPIAEVQPLARVRAESVAQPRFITLLLSTFAGVALVLAAIGVYGTLAYLVTQRTGEIGIRMALGARARGIARMVVGQGVGMAALGAVIGLGAALGLSGALEHLLFGVTRTDPLTFVLVPLGLVAVAGIASYLPARRATRVDPLVALRGD